MSGNEDEPDFTKPLSRFNAPVWAMKHGIAAAFKSDARWAVLQALFTFLPNVYPGKDKIEELTGLSHATVWRAIKDLKAVGLINYAPNLGGSKNTNSYEIADIRLPEIAEAIVKRIPVTEQSHRKRVSQRNGFPMKHEPSHGETSKGLTMSPEVHNISTQERTTPAADTAVPSSSSSGDSFGDGNIPSGNPNAQIKRKVIGKLQSNLTAEEMNKICSHVEYMTRYLLFGKDAVEHENPKSLPPTRYNWRRHGGTMEDPKADNWTLEEFMAFYWYRVSYYRTKNGMKLTLPNWGKLKKQFAILLDTVPKADLFNRIQLITDHFDYIQKSLPKATIDLDESSLTHGLIQPIVTRLAGMGQNELEDKLNRPSLAA